MTLGERIKKMRRSLDLTQQKFAEQIGTTQNNIASYEIGRREPSAAAINNICKTFNVNETWLRTGEGEMFLPKPSTVLDLLAIEHNLTGNDRILIEKFLSLKPDMRRALIDYLRDVAAAITTEEADNTSTLPPAPSVPAAPGDSADYDLEAEVEAYRRRRIEEKRQATQTSAANGSGSG